MRFYQTILAGAALVAAALAVEINDFPSEVEAGKSYKVTYSPGGDTPTTFILRKGDNDDLDTLSTLTESATGGEFTWNVDSGLADGEDYALEIRQPGAEPNFIGPIALTGGTEASASASASSAASTGSASASASATASESSSGTVTGTESAASATVSSTGGNSTVSLATLTRTSTAASETATETGSETTGASAPENTGAASSFSSSPLALVFGAVAAIAYLN